jgi:acyl carrier protein
VVLDSRDLRQALAEVLPAHMVPGAIVVLEALPLNNNGKVDRAALPLPDNLRNDASAGFVDARNDAERKIAAIWRELLAVERVGVDDNFFELGGHSLLVIPLRDRLQQLFGRNLSPVEIFRLPTVATQARFLSAPTLPNASAEQVNAARQAAQRQRDAFRQMKEKRLNRGG